MSRRPLVAVAAALAAGALAAAASAHVTVTPDTAVQGEPATLAFTVPNERDDASTTGFQLFFPDGAPVAAVTVEPVAGWRHTVAPARGGPVASVAWTATGDGLDGEKSAAFTVRIGTLPRTDRMVFKALQTYSDGSVVRWIQEAEPGQDAPERPAPTVVLTPPGGAPPAAEEDAGGGSGVWIAVAVVGGLCLAAGAAFVVLRRRRS